MDIQEALEVVRKLLNGEDPSTGQTVRGDSLFQHAQVTAALNRAAQALEFQKQRERTRASLPANAGKPWSNAEDAQICEEIRHGIDFQEIARIHCRTAGSIVARLIRLGKISTGSNQQRVKSAPWNA